MKNHRARSWHVTLVASARHPQLACGIWYVALLGLRFVPGVDRHLAGYMVFALVSAVAASIVMDQLGRGKIGTLELSADRIATRLGKAFGVAPRLEPFRRAEQPVPSPARPLAPRFRSRL